MKLMVERLPESQVQLDIAADEAEFAAAMNRAYKKVAREVNLPGFRKGKAPRQLIEQRFGRGVFLEEAHEEMLERLYREALEQEQLVPVGQPQVEITELEPIAFRVVVPVYPTVDPGEYQSVRVEPVDASINESDVDEVIERLRKARSEWTEVEESRSPVESEQVTVDLTVNEGDTQFQEPVENALFVLGETNLFEGLREKLEKMTVGETATVELNFAEDNEDVSPTIRGKSLTYTITLKVIKRQEMVPLDDEFAKGIGEVESVDELREVILNDLRRGKTGESRTEVLNAAINAMAEGATVEIPSVMIDEAVDDEVNQMRNRLGQAQQTLELYLRENEQTEEELRAELRPDAARRLRNSLLIQEISKRESVEVTDEDIDADIERAAISAKDPTRLRELYGNEYFRRILRNDLYERKVTDKILELARGGEDAVLNAWVAPEPEPAVESDSAETPEDAPVADNASPDDTMAVATAESDTPPVPDETPTPDETPVPDEAPTVPEQDAPGAETDPDAIEAPGADEPVPQT